MIVVVMGLAGAGKTTVGRALAHRLGWAFADADDYHSDAARAKMAGGEGLSDAERTPWLERLATLIAYHAAQGAPLVLACSALKAWYRARLAVPGADIRFVWLDVPAEVLADRLRTRRGHFAGPNLLPSQIGDFEPPAEALRLPPEPVETLVERVVSSLGGGV